MRSRTRSFFFLVLVVVPGVAAAEPPKPPVVPRAFHAPIRGPEVHVAPAPVAPPAIVLPARASGLPPLAARGFRQEGTTQTAWGDIKTLPRHSEEARLWRVANRANPGFSKSGRDRFVGVTPERGETSAERHVNCVLTSLSFEDSMRGAPTVAMSNIGTSRVSPELLAQTKTKLGADFATRYTGDEKESVLYAAAFPNVSFEHTDDFHVLEQRLATSGPGARMIFVGTWKAPTGETGEHAINMVNENGTVVVVDAQSGEVRKPAAYFSDVTWSKFHFHVTAEGAPGKSLFAEADAAR